MPIGGTSITWDESSPSDDESAGLGDDRIRAMKTAVRQGVGAEHNWSSGGGAATGYHLFGSARPYYGVQSTVSSSGSDGRLMHTSDTSRLFGVGSGGTTYIGGAYGLSVNSMAGITFPQRHILAMDFGQGITDSSGSTTVTIPNSGYSGVPFIQVTSVLSVAGANVVLFATPVNGATFIVSSIAASNSAFASSITFHWQSIGTRVL